MYPDVWGQHLWRSLHFIALGYPAQPTADDIAQYRQFFVGLANVIPCSKCADNYKRHLKELPIDDFLTDNDKLFAWTVEIHNIVNHELGKPLVSLDAARSLYLNSGNPPSNNVFWMYVLLITVILALALYIYMKRKEIMKRIIRA